MLDVRVPNKLTSSPNCDVPIWTSDQQFNILVILIGWLNWICGEKDSEFRASDAKGTSNRSQFKIKKKSNSSSKFWLHSIEIIHVHYYFVNRRISRKRNAELTIENRYISRRNLCIQFKYVWTVGHIPQYPHARLECKGDCLCAVCTGDRDR